MGKSEKFTFYIQFNFSLDATADSVVGYANISASVSAMQLNNLEVAFRRKIEPSLICFKL